RFRLGDRYDYARDFGGIRYLFCRGLDPAGDPSQGIYAHRYAPQLVQALDTLFAGNQLPARDQPLPPPPAGGEEARSCATGACADERPMATPSGRAGRGGGKLEDKHEAPP